MTAPQERATAKIDEFFAEIGDYEKAGQMKAAYDLARRVAEAAPRLAQAQNIVGLLAFKLGDRAQAQRWVEKAMNLAPGVAAYPRNLALVYHAANKPELALAMAQKAIGLAPDEAALHFNKALILYDSLRLEEGLAAVEQALALSPDYAEAHFLKAELYLLGGRLREGWESYERRFQMEQGKDMLPPTDKPQWDGRKLAPGRLLLLADQGFGDSIQFARYIPWVASLAPQPVLAASEDLLPLLRQIEPLGRLVRRWSDAGDYEAYMPLSGLPRLAGTTLATIPAPIPYLRADPVKLAFWQARLNELVPARLRRIGLVWAGRPAHAKDTRRSMTLAQFAPLMARHDIALITLQKGTRIDEIGLSFGAAPLVNLGPMITDFTDTLAILQLLERLVSVDTSVVHLAGASGVPATLLLPYAPDWRWLLHREESPWYPTLRLVRQEHPGDWAGVMARVAASL